MTQKQVYLVGILSIISVSFCFLFIPPAIIEKVLLWFVFVMVIIILVVMRTTYLITKKNLLEIKSHLIVLDDLKKNLCNFQNQVIKDQIICNDSSCLKLADISGIKTQLHINGEYLSLIAKNSLDSENQNQHNLTDEEIKYVLSQDYYASHKLNEFLPFLWQFPVHSNIPKPHVCPACTESLLVYFGAIQLPESIKFTYKYIPLFFCINCGTFLTHHGIHSKDPFERTGIKWHLSVEARNRAWSQNLLNALKPELCGTITSLIEIGGGVGWFMDEANKKGIKSIGFETNLDAVDYGRNVLGLDVRGELFTENTEVKFDLAVCISVLEHLEDGNELVKALATQCKKNNACLLISVPLCTTFLQELKNTNAHNALLRLVPWHVTHYSEEGLRILFTRYGATSIQKLSIPNSWNTFLIKF